MLIRPLILAAVTVVGSTAFAQTPPKPQTQPTGLAALNEDALLHDLAQRGLSRMLERAFELNNTPRKKRDAIRASAALNRLARNPDELTASQRREVIDGVAAGIAEIVPAMTDPASVSRQAELLIDIGIKPDVNTLEYWGESTATQAQLRPVVQAAIVMLDRAEQLAVVQVDALASTANAADDKTIDKIESLETLAQFARQNRALAGYYLALCLDPSDPRRAETAQQSLAFLADYNFDENPALKNLKLVLGKLHMVAGQFDAARDSFDSAAQLQTAKPEGVDEATFAQQQNNLSFEARYFRVVVEILARNIEQAKAEFSDLMNWERTAGLSDDPSIATANLLLEHRLLRASGTDADRQKASSLLITLLEQRPELESQVMSQLRATITSQTPVSTLEPLLLRSVMADAHEQVVRAQADKAFQPDPKVLARGIEAAREVLTRAEAGDGSAVDANLLGNSKFLLGVFLEAQGARVEAAGAFLRAASEHRERLELASAALNNAQRLFAQLGGINSEDPAVTALYDQILPLSIGEPFNQKELCYDWAYRLQQTGRAGDAAAYYRQVPSSDRRFAASRYYLMVALHQLLDEQPSDAVDRRKIGEEILSLAAAVQGDATKRHGSLPEGEQRTLQQRVARAVILAADVARTELDSPQQALLLLNQIELQVRGLPDQVQLLGEAMFTRIQAYMVLGQSDEAVKALVGLLARSGGEQGASIVFNMLSKLEADYSLAEKAGDKARMAKLQADRAALTPYLVQWSENNPRAEVAKFAYSYRVYDAETQRLAAEFLDDPVQRASKLQAAMKLFESLDTESARQQYRTSRSTPDRLGYDPQVALGKARIGFALGEWPAARDGYARLLSDRALGTPINSVSDAGQVRQVDNEVYWEATARLIRSKINASDPIDPVKTFLREQYVRWGDRVGGTKWKAEFDSLRQELIPEFVPESLGSPDSTGSPATTGPADSLPQ